MYLLAGKEKFLCWRSEHVIGGGPIDAQAYHVLASILLKVVERFAHLGTFVKEH